MWRVARRITGTSCIRWASLGVWRVEGMAGSGGWGRQRRGWRAGQQGRGSSATLMVGIPPGALGCCPRLGGAPCVAGEVTSPPERLWVITQSAQTQSSYPCRGVGCASGCCTRGLQQLVWKSRAHTKQDSSVCGGVGTAPHAEDVCDAARAACWSHATLASSAAATVQEIV